MFVTIVDVLTPVFVIVALGYVAAIRLSLDTATLTSLAYWILGPAFVFDILADAELAGSVVIKVVGISLATMLIVGLAVGLIARTSGRTRMQTGALVMTSVHGNVGNFGLAIIAFGYGLDALPLAGIVMVTVNTAGILTGVAMATSDRAGPLVALRTAFLAPMALAVVPALLVNLSDVSLPAVVDRPVGLLANALIPMILLTLGMQMRRMHLKTFESALVLPLAAKLVAAPIVAAVLVALTKLGGIADDVVIIQAAMPAAVFTSLIALEHGMEPDLVTKTVLVGTLVSAVTLPIVLGLV